MWLLTNTLTEDAAMLKRIVMFTLLFVLAIVAIFLAILLGERGPWYFAWLLGTATVVLVAAAGGAMLDAQEDHALEKKSGRL
jgi:predicted outer membrane lipoprotein